MENREYQRRVVCAANRNYKTGDIILGARHWDSLMHEAFKLWKNSNNLILNDMMFKEQGFIDQHGVFMDRQEAWKVAKEANQIIRLVGGNDSKGGTLYSENLY